jgi:hypothetical protein
VEGGSDGLGEVVKTSVVAKDAIGESAAVVQVRGARADAGGNLGRAECRSSTGSP